MINELYLLSNAMEHADITAQSWHRKYRLIPNVSTKAPCFRIVLSNGKISEISMIVKELGACLHKYGSNQGTFNGCNLVPLYRVTDESVKNRIQDLTTGRTDSYSLFEIKSWCVKSNWGRKFRAKYAISMKNVPEELRRILSGSVTYAPMLTLIEEAAPFTEPQVLYDALEKAAFTLLEQKNSVTLALQLLFHVGSAEKRSEDDTGALSVVFDSRRLIDEGHPAVSRRFTQELNRILLEIDGARNKERNSVPLEESTLNINLADTVTSPAISTTNLLLDAFGLPFAPLEEPMPSVKLAGGFEVTLRTMFGAVRCQSRYGRTDNASYPISPELRLRLQAALSWLGDAKHKHATWINLDKNEILFAYPHTLPATNPQFVRAFKHVPNHTASFENEAKLLLDDLSGLNPGGARAHAERLTVFVLRKLDKARAKVLYTRLTDAQELKTRTEAWSRGCQNLPMFPFGQPPTPFPMDIADTLNRMWKQDGTLVTDKFKPIPHYHGMELMMEKDEPVTQDLALLAANCICLAPYVGMLSATDRSYSHPLWWKVMEMLVLCGLMLDRLNARREYYMEDFPFLYGQLLKLSDEIHVFYCQVVRKNGEVPPQLAGSGLVQAATEAPISTLNLLRQRMLPYINWIKSYRYKGVTEENKKSSKAAELIGFYEDTATKLYKVWDSYTRLNDAEKAQLFLGYIAALPKNDKSSKKPQAAAADNTTINVSPQDAVPDNTIIDANETEDISHE